MILANDYILQFIVILIPVNRLKEWRNHSRCERKIRGGTLHIEALGNRVFTKIFFS